LNFFLFGSYDRNYSSILENPYDITVEPAIVFTLSQWNELRDATFSSGNVVSYVTYTVIVASNYSLEELVAVN